MRLKLLENRASDTLRLPIRIGVCDSDEDAADLNAAENAQLARFETDARRRDWRRGRLALKSVLRSLDRSDDTSDIRLPMPQLSLTHGAGTAIAIGTPQPGARIGVDVEAPRAVNMRMAQWFLNEEELDWLSRCEPSDRSNALIRLWTIKEAVFKCHPANDGLVMTDIAITSPSPEISDVHTADGMRFRCASFHEDVGIISIATQGVGDED